MAPQGFSAQKEVPGRGLNPPAGGSFFDGSQAPPDRPWLRDRHGPAGLRSLLQQLWIATMGTQIILGCPRGSCPDLKATSAPTVRHSDPLVGAASYPALLRAQPFRATPRGRLRAPSKGRLIRCTVPGSTPNCLAMTRTPGLSRNRQSLPDAYFHLRSYPGAP